MKGLYVITLMLLLLSCSEAKEAATTENPVENTAINPEAADTTASSADAEITTGVYSASDFDGKLFLMGNGTRDESCIVTTGCDCCLSDLLFLSDDTFVLSSFCEGSQTVQKGKYSISGNVITFDFYPLIVSYEYNWEREVDSTAVEFFLKSEKQELGATKFTIATCQASLILMSAGIARIKEPGTELAMENTAASLAEKIYGMQEKGIWQKLEI